MPSFGWKKDAFIKEPSQAYKGLTVPESVDLSRFAPDVRDQGNEGSCVGFGIGGILSATARMLDVYLEWFSPRWIYNGARNLEGRMQEEGAYPRDALEWLKRKGCLLESLWPYIAGVDSALPPRGSLDFDADDRPLLSYTRLVDGVQGIVGALAQNQFVALGTPWFETWMTPYDGQLPEVTKRTQIAGGHEYMVHGYDLQRGMLNCQNSWGKGWAKNGHFYVPMSAVDVWKATWGYDAHVVTVDWAGVIEAIKRYRLQQSDDDGRTWRDVWAG